MHMYEAGQASFLRILKNFLRKTLFYIYFSEGPSVFLNGIPHLFQINAPVVAVHESYK